MPINEAMKQHVMRAVERRVLSSGFFDFEAPTPAKDMSYNSQQDPCERIRDAERAGKISAAFSRSAQALVKQGKWTAAQADEFIAALSKRPVGAGRVWSDDEE